MQITEPNKGKCLKQKGIKLGVFMPPDWTVPKLYRVSQKKYTQAYGVAFKNIVNQMFVYMCAEFQICKLCLIWVMNTRT